MLNADFLYAVGDSLSLQDFTNSNGTLNDESITISSDATGTLFTLSEGVWGGAGTAGQVETLNSNTTLKLFSTAANGLTNGISVDDSMSVGLDVKFENVNSLGGLLGPALFSNVGSIEQAAGTTIDIDDVDIDALGDVEIDFAAGVNLEKVETANGDITISSLGTLTATEVRTGMNNAISLTATGATSDIEVETIDAGTGDVTLDAEDDIHDSNSADANIVTGGTLTTASSNSTNDANNGITLDTNITDLRLDTTSSFDVDNTGILTNLEITVDPAGTSTYALSSGGVANFSVLDVGADLSVSDIDTAATFSITTNSGNVTIGEIDAGGLVSITATAGSIIDATDDSLVDITSVGLITLTARDDIAGMAADGKLELAAGSQVVAMSTTAGDIRLRGIGALTLVGVTAQAGSIDVTATGGSLDIEAPVTADNVFLDAGTTIDQTATGVITASTLLVIAGGDVTLGEDNVVDNFAATLSAGNLLFQSVNDLTIVSDSIDGMPVDGVGAPGFAKLISTGSLNLNAPAMADNVFLMAGTTIDQTATGVITAGTLLVMAGGDVTLDEDNVVDNFAATLSVGNLLFKSVNDLTIVSDSIDGMPVDGVGAPGFAKLISAGSLDLTASVGASDVFFMAGTTIDQTATGVITAGTLLVMAGSDVTLGEDNVVDNFAATLSAGNLLFKSVNDLTIVSDSIDGMPVDGVGAPGFAKLISTGSLNLNASVEASEVFLMADTTIDQTATGLITATTLLVMAGGDVTLDEDNVVDNFAATVTAGNLLFKSVNDLTIVSDSIDGMPVDGVGAPGFAKLISTGSLNLNAPAMADNVFLIAGTTIDQTAAGVITAGTLLVMAGGNVTLGEDNVVDNFAATLTAGNLLFKSVNDLTIVSDSIDGMPVDGVGAPGFAKLISTGSLNLNAQVMADNVFLMAGTTIDQTAAGVITAGTLLVMANGDVTLQADNQVENIAADVNGSIYFKTITDLTVTTASVLGMEITGVSADGKTDDGSISRSLEAKLESGGNLRLMKSVEANSVFLGAGSGITQDAGTHIDADRLLLMAGDDVELDKPTNNVRFLAANITNGSLLFKSTQAITIDNLTVDGMNIVGITIAADGTFGSLELDIKSKGGDIDQAIGAPIKVEVETATFSVPDGFSILLSDIPTDNINVNDADNRKATENIFFVDTDDKLMETDLVFETDPAGKIKDLTIVDQTLVELKNIDITGDLIVLGGRTLDTQIQGSDTSFLSLGEAIIQDGAVIVAGKAQFHAIEGRAMDDSILLDELEIEGVNQATRDTIGNLAVTTIGRTNDVGGNALIANDIQIAFRSDVDTDVEGNLKTVATTGNITDAEDFANDQHAKIFVGGNATFKAEDGNIVLANENEVANMLTVVGRASFITLNQGIVDVGVRADGTFAAALVELGSLSFNTDNDGNTPTSGQVRIAEDSDMQVVLGDFDHDGTADEVNEGGQITLSTTASPFNIDLDSMTVHELKVDSQGYIHDAPYDNTGSGGIDNTHQSDIRVTTDAHFKAVADIVLANGSAANQLIVEDHAQFISTGQDLVDVGVRADGTFAAAMVKLGTLSFNTDSDNLTSTSGQVRIAEDSDMQVVLGDFDHDGTADEVNEGGEVTLSTTPQMPVDPFNIDLDSMTVHELKVDSQGYIHDAPYDNTGSGGINNTHQSDIRVTTDAHFKAATNIVLANDNDASNQLIVEGHAQFVSSGQELVDVGVRADGTFAAAIVELGTLSFKTDSDGVTSTSGEVRIAEDSDMQVALGDFNHDGTADEVNEGGKVTLSTTAMPFNIDLDSMTVHELDVDSQGYIHDAPYDNTGSGGVENTNVSKILVTTDAAFRAFGQDADGRAIVLADITGGELKVIGDARFHSIANGLGIGGGYDIMVGINPGNSDRMTDSGATVELGGTNFDSRNMDDSRRGDVSLYQDNRIEFFGVNYARSLVATSSEFIVDRNDTIIDVRDVAAGIEEANATFKALGVDSDNRAIVLANVEVDVIVVELFVEDNATFLSETDGTIDVGVTPVAVNMPDDSSRGADSEAEVIINGNLRFNSTLGDLSHVTINEDTPIELEGVNRAGSLVLVSDGSITDAAMSTSLQVNTKAAFFLTTTNSDILLGDGDAQLDLHRVEVADDEDQLVNANGVGVGNQKVRHVSFEEGFAPVPADPSFILADPSIILEDVLVTETLFVSNINSAGNILQDLPTEVPQVDESTLTKTKIVAPSAGFQTTAGAVILRNTKFDHLAVDAKGMGTNGAFDIAEHNVADLDAIIADLKRSTKDPVDLVANRRLQPVEADVSQVVDLSVDSFYGFVLGNNSGDLQIGDTIIDPANGNTKIHGIVVANGHAFVKSSGDIAFSGSATGSVVVEIKNDHVFTAVAGGNLTIDTTVDPETGAVIGTATELVSSTGGSITGKVLSVGIHENLFDGRLPELSDTEEKAGPRLDITPLDDPSEDTTKIVQFIDGSATQQITLQIGVTGEENFIVDVAYADVIGELTEIPPGSQIPADLLIGDRVLERAGVNAGDLVLEKIFMDVDFFRVDVNPNGIELPTEIRLFNDPRINLFESNGARNLNRSISVLRNPPSSDSPNAPLRQDNYVQPQMIISPITVEQQAPPRRILLPLFVPEAGLTPDMPTSFEQESFDQIRPAVQKEDRVYYGPLDEENKFENSFPWEEGNTKETYIEDIKREVRGSDDLLKYPPGKYAIEVISAKGAKKESIPFDKVGETAPANEDGTTEDATDEDQGASTNQPSHREAPWVHAWQQWSTPQSPEAYPATPLPVTNSQTLRADDPVTMIEAGRLSKQADFSALPVMYEQGTFQQSGEVLTPISSDILGGTSLLVGSLVMAGRNRRTEKNVGKTAEMLARWWPK